MKSITEKYFIYLTTGFVFFVYLLTIAPSVIQIDSGELAAVISIPGIAHPTGYPLFTLAGFLFLKIPLPFTVIFKANLFASILVAGGVLFFLKSALLLAGNITTNLKKETKSASGSKKKKRNEQQQIIRENIKIITIPAAILGGLLLAFCRTVWFQSNSIEVYSLHFFLLNILFYFSLKSFFPPPEASLKTNSKYWLVTSFFLALCFTNHMTSILVVPGFAYLFYRKNKLNKYSFRLKLLMLLIFLVTITAFYSYLPLRAAAEPALNWGNPDNWERLVRHLTGSQYQSWIFTSFDSAKKQFEYFLNNLPLEFGYTGLIPVLAGIYYSFKKFRSIFYFILINFVTCVFYSINYDITDIDAYFILAYISFGFWGLFGFIQIFLLFQRRKISSYFAGIGFAVIILFQIFFNYKFVDQSNNYAFEDYTKALIGSTEKNSLIMSYLWDYFISASYYFQIVEGYRDDVTIIDKELLRRSWYYDQVARNFPYVTESLKPLIGQFKEALVPFERSEKFDSALLEKLFQKILSGIPEYNYPVRDIYLSFEMVEIDMQKGNFSLPEGFSVIPDLFLYRVVKGNEYVPAPKPDFKIRFPETENPYLEFLRKTIPAMLAKRALYELKFSKIEKAKEYVDKMRTDFPEFIIPVQLRSL